MAIDYRIFDRDKFTVVGTPTITDDGIASGFSKNVNYLKSAFIDLSNANSWVIETPFFNINQIDTSDINFILSNHQSSASNLELFIRGNGKMSFGVSDTDAYNPIAKKDSTKVFEVGKSYQAKLVFSGTEYSFYYRESLNSPFILDWSIPSTRKIVQRTDYLYLCTGNGVSLNASYDLKQFSITVDGVEVFSGSHLGTLTDKLIYLNDTKQIIKQAIVDKGVEITPGTPFREYADKIGEISGGGGDDPEVIAKLDIINGEVI